MADSEADIDMVKFYEERIRPLETEEFVKWFEDWYGDDALHKKYGALPAYLSERRFALIGWIASRMPENDRYGGTFLAKLLEPLGETATEGA